MRKISSKKKRSIVLIEIIGIIVIVFMIRQIKGNRVNNEWYRLKKETMTEQELIGNMSIVHNGPYCKIRIETKEEIKFEEVEKVFMKILGYFNSTDLKDELIARHEGSFLRADLACLKIVFVNEDSDSYYNINQGDMTATYYRAYKSDIDKPRIWEFESWDRYEYRTWEFYSKGYDEKKYDLYDYR